MNSTIDQRLAELGITLPEAVAPAANYVPAVITGNLLFVSGQIAARPDGTVITGHLGDGLSVEEGQEAARACAINVLSQARAVLAGDLERISRIVRITGFVASTPDFSEQHLVVNGASDMLVDLLGEAGRHTRAAFGVTALPLGSAVEVDAIMEIR